jgi:hypothetical protein
MENLRARAKEKLRIVACGPIFAVFLDGNCEASTMLLDELWDVEMRAQIGGDLVAAVPSRDILAVGPADSGAARRELRDVVARLPASSNRVLVQDLFLRRRGRWEAVAN